MPAAGELPPDKPPAGCLAHEWPASKPDLDGKIHLIVGMAETFYRDGAAHRLRAERAAEAGGFGRSGW